jgi:hypothetical protein
MGVTEDKPRVELVPVKIYMTQAMLDGISNVVGERVLGYETGDEFVREAIRHRLLQLSESASRRNE